MSEKKIVAFKEMPVLSHPIDYLKYCKSCSTYGLGDRPCVKCGREDMVSIDEIVEKTVHKHLISRISIALIMYLIMYLTSMDFLQTAGVTLCTLVIVGLELWIYRRYKDDFKNKEMEKHIHANIDKIRADMKSQFEIATNEVDAGNLLGAYERLRYLGKLMDNEEVRTFKLICLRNFELRSDMPLEVDSLLQEDCNLYLIDYLYEVSKVRKDLIDEKAVLYLLTYKEEVLAKPKGQKIMASVLEACLHSKYMLSRYAKYMLGYLRYFSRDRLLRFCRLSSCIEDEVLRRALIEEVKQAVGTDEAFAIYFQESEEV